MPNSSKPYQNLIDCEIEPYNIYPIVESLMSAENWLLKNIPSNQKIVLILAEKHDATIDIAIHQAILGAHTAQFHHNAALNFAFGTEQPHNLYAPHITQNSKKLIQEFVKDPPVDCLPVPNKRLMQFCLDHNISTRFNDIADYSNGNDDYIIDQSDQFSRDIIQNYNPSLLDNDDIIRTSEYKSDALGLTLSNLAIVQKAKQHIKEKNVEFISKIVVRFMH